MKKIIKQSLALMCMSTMLVLQFQCNAQTPKAEVIEKIEAWYANHADGYTLDLGEVEPSIERYHPERLEEKDDLLRIRWKGMEITMTFGKYVREFEWTAENLQKELMYYVIDDIYHDIDVKGWEINPRVPVSSSSEGIRFEQLEDGNIRLTIDWETYTVMGYLQSEYCKDQLGIADSSMPESCYVSVRKRLPLHIDAVIVVPKK